MNHTVATIKETPEGNLLVFQSGYKLLVPKLETHASGEVIWIGHEPKQPLEVKGKPLAGLLGKTATELRSVAGTAIIVAGIQVKANADEVLEALVLYDHFMEKG